MSIDRESFRLEQLLPIPLKADRGGFFVKAGGLFGLGEPLVSRNIGMALGKEGFFAMKNGRIRTPGVADPANLSTGQINRDRFLQGGMGLVAKGRIGKE